MSRRMRLSVLLCIAIAISGWTALPIPISWVQPWVEELQWGDLQLKLRPGSIRIRWATGKCTVDRLEIEQTNPQHQADRTLVYVPRASFHIGLSPFHRGFLQPTELLLLGPKIEVDPQKWKEWQRVFATQEKDTSTPLPTLEVRLEKANLRWSDPEQNIYLQLRVAKLLGKVMDGQVYAGGVLELPFGQIADLRVEGQPEQDDWQIDLVGRPHPLSLQQHERLPLPPCGAKECRLRIHAEKTAQTDWRAQFDVHLREGHLTWSDPQLELHGFRLDASGDLQRGVRLDCNGHIDEFAFRATGSLIRNSHSQDKTTYAVHARGFTDPIRLDASTLEKIRRLDPGAVDPFEALELRGETPLALSLDWTLGQRPDWIAHADFEDFESTFRGFLEGDGDRPALPVPLRELTGHVAFAPPTLLLDVRGIIPPPSDNPQTTPTGKLNGKGALTVGGGPAGIELDLQFEDFSIDRRTHWAMAGFPDIGNLWRDFGSPNSGIAQIALRLRRKHLIRELGLEIEASIRQAHMRPSFLPIPIKVQQANVYWRKNFAKFEAEFQAEDGHGVLSGQVLGIQDSTGIKNPRPLIQARASIRDIRPNGYARRVLNSYLDLPDGAHEYVPAGPMQFEVDFLRPGFKDAQVFVDWQGQGVQLTWQPTRFVAEQVFGRLWVLRRGNQSLISAPRILASLDRDPVAPHAQLTQANPLLSPDALQQSLIQASAQLIKLEEDESGFLLLQSRGTHLSSSLVATAQRVMGIDPAKTRLRWHGSVSGALELQPPFASESGPGFAADFNLQPILIENFLPASSEDNTNDSNLIRVSGPLAIRNTSITSNRIAFSSSAGDLEFHNFEFNQDASGMHAWTELHSELGIELNDQFAALVSPGIWSAIQRIGLGGKVGAAGLQLELHFPTNDTPRFSATGPLRLHKMVLHGPPRMNAGSADLFVDWFEWMGPQTFGGELQMRNGEVQVSGLKVSDAVGFVTVSDVDIAFEQLEASALGGTIRTFGPHPDGHPEEGRLQLGLTPEAPLQVLLHFDRLSLARMRDELGLGGALAGRLSGRIQFRSKSPNPLDYTGRGAIEVTDGVLGTVPGLAQLFQIAGVREPQFQTARFNFWTHAERNRGRIRIASYDLAHQFLEVKGDGWLDWDGYLQASATIRTLSFFTRIWPISLIVDLLAEHDVYGPLEDPVVSHRIGNRVVGRRPLRVPFPLWLPEIPQPDWRRSPALPITESPPNRPVPEARREAPQEQP